MVHMAIQVVNVTISSAESVPLDTSNFKKHTHGNPLQRKLIDRFHHVIGAQIIELAPDTFLDAGCGEGFVSRYLLERSPGLQITGFDANPDCVALAQDLNPSGEYITADITDLPFESKSFDVAGCFEVLEHLHAPDRAVEELLRVTRNALVLSVPHEPYFSLANAARGKNLDIRPRGSDPDHRQFWSRYAFETFIERHAHVEWIGGSFPWTICVATPKT
ncbi:hypothetical protein BH23CHL5_BH23CHL5_08410 [soil metagenome]